MSMFLMALLFCPTLESTVDECKIVGHRFAAHASKRDCMDQAKIDAYGYLPEVVPGPPPGWVYAWSCTQVGAEESEV